MIRQLVNKLFRATEKFPDGALVFYGHKECICYQDGPRRSVEFEIEYDGKLYILIQESSYWKGELSGKIDKKDIDKIKERIDLYFKKRGLIVELR
jgi:hypothetical protein